MGTIKQIILSGMLVAGVNMASAQETCTAIDAVTSASTRFTTLGGSQYCATTATIKWQDYYNNGTRYIEWGTSTSYGNKITLSGKTGTSALTPLTPNTLYYWRVNRLYNGKNPLTPAGSFTTSAAQVVLPPVITSAESVICTTGTAKTYTAAATDPAGKTVTFTFSGLPSWITALGAVLTINAPVGSIDAIVKIIASNGSGSDTLDLAVTVVQSTGIKVSDHVKNSILIAGVPFKLLSGNGSVSMSIYSLDGSLVYRKTFISPENLNDQKSLIDIQRSGTYICKIKGIGGETGKLITLQK